MLNSKDKVAIWMEGSLDDDYGKMGISAMRYLENEIVCVIDSTHSGKVVSDVSPILKKDIVIVDSLETAKSMGASVLLMGVLTSGGVLPDHWEGMIIKALKLELSLINGLHVNLNNKYSSYIVDKKNQWIWDTRIPQFIPKIGSGEALKLNNKRVLMIGTDMAAGKMTAGLELYSYLKDKNIKVSFTFLNIVNKKNLQKRLQQRKSLNRYDKFKMKFYNKVQNGFLRLSKKNLLLHRKMIILDL